MKSCPSPECGKPMITKTIDANPSVRGSKAVILSLCMECDHRRCERCSNLIPSPTQKKCHHCDNRLVLV